ncbi:MAG TPA: ribosomal protein S18-alanine N-acetyltransferase [Bacillota bacterium]|nr:ribosomal protein S18-alanine N-acetyltransferase [Bacillota bacterium]HPT60870.1 ribosomal protein S18-alanine N-acetyltransferase [Bacillota bacterium]
MGQYEDWKTSNVSAESGKAVFTIRRAVFEDLEGIARVERESFTTPWTETSIGTELSLNIFARYFVAELEGEIVGFGGMWVVVDEAHITNIAVLEKHRRQGIGRAILHTLLSTAKEERCRAATLEVRVGNIQARRLYESFGFAPVGIRPKYYSDTNEDALIMWCVLE